MTRHRTTRRQHAVEALVAAVASEPRVWTRAQLCDRWSEDTLGQATSLGLVSRVGPGLYSSHLCARTDTVRIAAAGRWAAPHGRVGGIAALALYGLNRPLDRVLVVAPLRFSRTPLRGVRLWRTQADFNHHVFDGVATVTPADAAIQAWRESTESERTGTFLDAARTFNLSSNTLAERLSAYPRIPARAKLSEIISVIGEGVTSYLEYVAKTDVFEGSLFSDFEWQADLLGAGNRYRADMWHREARLAVEFDGTKFHSGDHARRRDIERDAALASAGITTMRFTYEDLVQRPQWCRDRVLEAVNRFAR